MEAKTHGMSVTYKVNGPKRSIELVISDVPAQMLQEHFCLAAAMMAKIAGDHNVSEVYINQILNFLRTSKQESYSEVVSGGEN